MNEIPFDFDRNGRFALHAFRVEQPVDQRVQFGAFEKNDFAENLIFPVETNATGQNVLQPHGLLFDERTFRIVEELRPQGQTAQIEEQRLVRVRIRRNDDVRRVERDVQMNFERLFLKFLHLFVRGIGLTGGEIQRRFGDVQRVQKRLNERIARGKNVRDGVLPKSRRWV